MGLPVGMLLGLAVGIAKDERSNGQENVAVSKDNMKTQEMSIQGRNGINTVKRDL